MRYRIYSIEHGSSPAHPYTEDDSREIAEAVVKCMAESTRCRWFVYDTQKRANVYLIMGDSQFANQELEQE